MIIRLLALLLLLPSLAFSQAALVGGSPATNINNLATTTLTITITQPTSGNLMVGCGCDYFAALDADTWSVTTPASVSEAIETDAAAIGADCYIAYKIAGASEGTSWIQESTENDEMSGAYAEFSGVLATPLDQASKVDDTQVAVQTRNSGSVTTTTANSLIVACFGGQWATESIGARNYTNSFTEAAFVQGSAANDSWTAMAYRVVSSTGTYDTDITITEAARRISGVIAAFKSEAAPAASTRRPITPIIMHYIEPEGVTPWASLKQAWSRLFGLFH